MFVFPHPNNVFEMFCRLFENEMMKSRILAQYLRWYGRENDFKHTIDGLYRRKSVIRDGAGRRRCLHDGRHD